jgi:two-component system nitrate/nitrite response regulator NarL
MRQSSDTPQGSDDALVRAPSPLLTIVFCDDEPQYRLLLAAMLGQHRDLQVIAETADGGAAIRACREHQPDVLLLDQHLPGMEGVDVARHVLRVAPDTTVLLLTGDDDPALREQALAAGARDVLLKRQPPDELIAALRMAAIRDGDAGARGDDGDDTSQPPRDRTLEPR